MNAEVVTAIAAAVAAIALLVCLPLVVLQLKALVRERRIAELHAVMDAVDDCSKFIVHDQSTADIWWRASKGVEHLTDAERVRYFAILFIMFRAWERAFRFRSEHPDDGLNAEIITRPLADFARSNGVQEYWVLRRRWFTPEFGDWVEQQMKERSGVDVYGEQFRIFGSADQRAEN